MESKPDKQVMWSVVGPLQYDPTPASGDLNSNHIFQLAGHCACWWCSSSYSISIPCLQLVSFPTPKICLNCPGDLDLMTSKWGHDSCHGLPFSEFSASYALPFST